MTSDYVKPQFDGRITLLKILASFVNPSDVVQITVTLSVNGVIVTGTMIGTKPYYEGITEKLKETIRSSSEEINIAVRRDMEKIFEDLKQSPSLEELEKGYDYELIYLKNAQFHTGGDFFPHEGSYWVGKIESVDGFILGSFAPIPLP